jgi:hypothetical protein
MEKFCFCFKNYRKHQNFLVLFQSFQISSTFVLKNSGTHQNVLVLFQSFGNKWKSSAFVLTIFGTHQNVLVSLRFSAPISERLCFRFGIVDITT